MSFKLTENFEIASRG